MSQLLIKFEAAAEPDFHYRVRSFAEVVHREVSMNDMASVPGKDTVTDQILVVVSVPRYVASVQRAIRALLARHNLAGQADVIPLL